jgi:hypothetical protein
MQVTGGGRGPRSWWSTGLKGGHLLAYLGLGEPSDLALSPSAATLAAAGQEGLPVAGAVTRSAGIAAPDATRAARHWRWSRAM